MLWEASDMSCSPATPTSAYYLQLLIFYQWVYSRLFIVAHTNNTFII